MNVWDLILERNLPEVLSEDAAVIGPVFYLLHHHRLQHSILG